MRAAPVLLAIALLFHGAAAQPPPGANEPSPANGPELRELSRSLSRAASGAREAARSRAARASRELTARLDDLVRSARSLEARTARGATARELENEVAELERTAGRVDAALAAGPAPASVVRPYRDAGDALKRVRALVEGAAASARPRAGGPTPLSSTPDELGAIARDVEERMTLTQEAADRFSEANPGYSAELVGDVDRLAKDARELRRAVESGRADARDVRRLADRLLDGARSAGELMRATESFRDAWGAWDQAIADLARMTELLPSV